MGLASGSLDVGSAATAAVINAIASGNDFVAVYPSNGINDEVQSIFYVLEDSPIQNPRRHRGQDHRGQHARRPPRLHGPRGAARRGPAGGRG